MIPLKLIDIFPGQCTTYVYNKLDGQCACGFFLSNGLTWLQAKDGCAAQGGILPEIYSPNENANIFNLRVRNQKRFD